MSKYIKEAMEKAAQLRAAQKAEKPERPELLMTALTMAVPNIVTVIEDSSDPMLGLNISRREDGGWLAIAKRENEDIEQVIMSYADSFEMSLVKLNHAIIMGYWKKNKTWKERQAELKAAEQR